MVVISCFGLKYRPGLTGLWLLAVFCVLTCSDHAGSETLHHQDMPASSKSFDMITTRHPATRLPAGIDASPLPNYQGDFVSLGLGGIWRRPPGSGSFARADITDTAPAADCSRKAIIYYAERAPANFEKDKKGLLYGVTTHTPETNVWGLPGFNSCALVVYAILKQAGCSWVKRTANAKALYDSVYDQGWRPPEKQEAGCLVAWNSRWKGTKARIGQGEHRQKTKTGGVLFRHVGITTGSWMAVDNNSVLSRPTSFITFRPIVYEPPLFLCPPEQAAAPGGAK